MIRRTRNVVIIGQVVLSVQTHKANANVVSPDVLERRSNVYLFFCSRMTIVSIAVQNGEKSTFFSVIAQRSLIKCFSEF